MSFDGDTLRELRKITRILSLANADAIERELTKIVSTDERRRMWVLIDGQRMPKDIAIDGKVSERAVNYFLNAAITAEIIEHSRGKPPRRVLDYVPVSWIELVKLPEPAAEGRPVPIMPDEQKDQESSETKPGS